MTPELPTNVRELYMERGHYVIHRRVSWAECDPAGIGYTPRFMDWLIEAVESFFVEVLQYPWQELHASGIAAPFVSAQLDFHAPVRVDDPLWITMSVGNVGRSSVVWDVIGRVSERHCFSGKAVTVFVDAATDKPRRVPERIREWLRPPAPVDES
jgi:4-hydroxybenzoyl-CoA thioesterase